MHSAQATNRPVIDAKDLSSAQFKTLMQHYGCVLVRGLISVPDVLQMRAITAQTYEIYDRDYHETKFGGAPSDGLFIQPEAFLKDRSLLRTFRDYGGLLLSSCPLAATSVVAMLSRSPVRTYIEDYFGAPIGLSANSSSVRLSERSSTVRRVFHQDGNFLGGKDTETINCWIALDPCGVDAPSMEVFPQRVDHLMPVGEAGATTPWEIQEEVVYRQLGKDNAWVPEFRAGDAFLFDHTHVHRTHVTPMMKKDRYALECWMFPIKERYRARYLIWLG
jgi:hypothetical protein